MTAKRSITLAFAPAQEVQLPQVLESIASTVEETGIRQRWGQELTLRVNLVLEELVTNILSYGAEPCGPTPAIDVTITSGDKQLTIEVSDNGKPFDPLKDAPPPPCHGSGDGPVRVGGLGVHLVKSLMDGVSYSYMNGRNHLAMTAVRSEYASSE